MDFDKLLTQSAIDTAVKILLHEQNRCGGTIPPNFYTRIHKSLEAKFIFIKRDALYQRVPFSHVVSVASVDPSTCFINWGEVNFRVLPRWNVCRVFIGDGYFFFTQNSSGCPLLIQITSQKRNIFFYQRESNKTNNIINQS
jgi:hypothetical protein